MQRHAVNQMKMKKKEGACDASDADNNLPCLALCNFNYIFAIRPVKSCMRIMNNWNDCSEWALLTPGSRCLEHGHWTPTELCFFNTSRIRCTLERRQPNVNLDQSGSRTNQFADTYNIYVIYTYYVLLALHAFNNMLHLPLPYVYSKHSQAA